MHFRVTYGKEIVTLEEGYSLVTAGSKSFAHMNQDPKVALREEMRHRLRELTVEDRESLSDEICERVLEMTQWAEAQSIVLFTPLPSEPIINPLKLDCEARKVAFTMLPQSP